MFQSLFKINIPSQLHRKITTIPDINLRKQCLLSFSKWRACVTEWTTSSELQDPFFSQRFSQSSTVALNVSVIPTNILNKEPFDAASFQETLPSNCFSFVIFWEIGCGREFDSVFTHEFLQCSSSLLLVKCKALTDNGDNWMTMENGRDLSSPPWICPE